MIKVLGQNAKQAKLEIIKLTSKQKSDVLKECAKKILENKDALLRANKLDLDTNESLKAAFKDRLTLNESRIEQIAKSIEMIANLDDPIGKINYAKNLENGLQLAKISVPIGVIAMIFESRPNVCADAFALCFKSSNVVILRGGKEAFNTNLFLVGLFQDVLKSFGMNENFVQILKSTSYEEANKLLKAREYIDVLIPRGSKRLIDEVVKESSIASIQTGVGNCHIFVDKSADLNNALEIIKNAKTQRPGVCNSVETVLIHDEIKEYFLPKLEEYLANVELRVCEKSKEVLKDSKLANEEDWDFEYEDLILAIKCVANIDEAITHIQKHSTGHSESILTNDIDNMNRFFNEIDSAVLYLNASTRFSDGGEFGFGAEIGISTQKLHARGPMGLEALCSYKYIVKGDGQIRV